MSTALRGSHIVDPKCDAIVGGLVVGIAVIVAFVLAVVGMAQEPDDHNQDACVCECR